MAEILLKPLWEKIFKSDINFVIIMFILLGIVRIIGLSRHEINLIVLGFLIMWVLPIVFLSVIGRKTIGLNKPNNWSWVFYLLSLEF